MDATDRGKWTLPDDTTIACTLPQLATADLEPGDFFVMARGFSSLLLVWRHTPGSAGGDFVGWIPVEKIPPPGLSRPYTCARDYHERTNLGLEWPAKIVTYQED